jgi:hypothetical protein
MQVNTLTHYNRLSEVHQNSNAGNGSIGSLRKAAEMMAPPKLSDDEMRMIRNEFPSNKPMVMYTGRGETRQEHVGGTGRMIDITV